ncbi:MAG TPA: energy transducer TonB [Flavobacteriales bacterium]|nr:energy transducer TonB [Flavobacteriales bacterium]
MRLLSALVLLITSFIVHAQYIDKAVFLEGPERAITDGPRSQPLNIACTFVIDLQVTREGKVSSVKTSESTCDSTVLAQAATRARNYVFSPAPTAPEPQHVRLWCRFGDRVVTETFDDVVAPEPSMEEPDESVFSVVEQMPQFPGGEGALQAYLAKECKRPQVDAEGKVYIRFTVEKDGAITDVKLLRGVHPELDAEALRVVKAMPKWIPGKQSGRPVRVQMNVPVIFRSQ